MTDIQSCGEMTIKFIETGGVPYPVCTFSPVGKITPNAIEHNLSNIYKAIQIAQVEARAAREAEQPPASPATPPRRRRAA
jgi:hypothetical protein